MEYNVDLNPNYDVYSCLSQSEDTNSSVLSVKSLLGCMRGRAMKTDPRYILVNVYQTIPMEDGCVTIFSKMADILTQVMQ